MLNVHTKVIGCHERSKRMKVSDLEPSDKIVTVEALQKIH